MDPDGRIAFGRPRALGALLHLVCVAEQHGFDVADAVPHAARKIAAPELGQYGVFDDELRHRVGHERLQPPADLDAHLAVVGRDEQEHAVVLALLPERPFAREPDAVVLDRIALERRHRGDRDLIR